MAKMNMAHLYGRVAKPPTIKCSADGEMSYGILYVDVVRSLRPVDDGTNFTKHDLIMVLSREKEILDQYRDLTKNTVVLIKGVITSRQTQKPSVCPHCKDENGNPVRNSRPGNMIYITPIFLRKIEEYEEDEEQEAVEDVIRNQEISNQAYMYCTVLTQPKRIRTKKGIDLTQYRVAINRKFTIRTDDVERRTDYPVVKSYGEQALDDFMYINQGTTLLIDGFLQGRKVTRKIKCEHCGQIYEYKDYSMEIIPYDTEYLVDYRTREEVEEENKMKVEDLKQRLFEMASHPDKKNEPAEEENDEDED